MDAAARLKWKFWRWRPKVSLCTFQILALFIGSIVLVYQRSQPWQAGMVLHCGSFPVNSVAFSADSGTILTAGGDGVTRLWNAKLGEQISSIDHKMRVLSADISPSGKTAAIIQEDGSIQIWDGLSTSKPSELFRQRAAERVKYSPDGGSLLILNSISLNGIFIDQRSFETDDLSLINVYAPADSPTSAVMSRDTKHIITATSDGFVQVWDTATQKAVAALRGDINFFRSAVFSPDGIYIATTGRDCTVRLWTAYTSNEFRTIIDADKTPAVQTDGRTWNAKPLAVMRGHNQYVLSSQFSPEGDRLATVSLDGSVRIWGGRDGAALSVLTTQGPWRSVVFSPDGNRLAAAGIDGTVQLWDRRCSERWYGKLALPEFWLMILLLPALFWSIRRDGRSLRGPHVPPDQREINITC
jgi:WD40 repeat protein